MTRIMYMFRLLIMMFISKAGNPVAVACMEVE